MLGRWKGGWVQEDSRGHWGLSSVAYSSQKMRTNLPQHGAHKEILLTSCCHFHTPSHISAEEGGNSHGETSTPTSGSPEGDSPPAPETGLCVCDKAGDFTVRRLKQTENYKVHKRIFHTAEPCKMFTLEFPFLNSLSQDSVWFGKPRQLSWKCVLLLLDVSGSRLQGRQCSEAALLFANSLSMNPASCSNLWQMWDPM